MSQLCLRGSWYLQNKAYRLINHGPTVLVSGRAGGVDNVMAAAWSCGLDYSPSKVTVVLDRATKTREEVGTTLPAGDKSLTGDAKAASITYNGQSCKA